jgi:hypothetical protein
MLQVMPNKLRVKVEGIFRDEQESTAAPAGENLRLRISGDRTANPALHLSNPILSLHDIIHLCIFKEKYNRHLCNTKMQL